MDREVWWATVHGVTVRQDWECTCILRSKGESKMQKQSQSLENMLNKSVLRNHLLGGWQTFLVKGQIANISVFVGYNVSHIFCFPTTPPNPYRNWSYKPDLRRNAKIILAHRPHENRLLDAFGCWPASCCCCSADKWCLTLCNPMDWSLSGSSVHGISQARILEWVAISFSRGSSWLRGFFTAEPQGSPVSL